MGAPRLIGLAAVSLVSGIVASLSTSACGDGYGEETAPPDVTTNDGAAPNELDAGPKVAPSLNCPLGCLPPAPSGWTGPSAVYDGTSAAAPNACPPLYTQKEREGQDGVVPGVASCSCGFGVTQGAKCTVDVSSYSASKCGAGATTVTKETPGTKCVDFPAGNALVEVGLAKLTEGKCVFPEAKVSALPPSFDRAAIACGLPQYAACTDRPECVASPIPDAPFTRLCIHKAGDEPCPSADYAARFTVFASVKDARACDCTATPFSSCGTSVTLFTETGCAGTSSASNSGLCDIAKSIDISAIGPFTKGCDKIAKAAVTGDVTMDDPMTFCCNK